MKMTSFTYEKEKRERGRNLEHQKTLLQVTLSVTATRR